MKKSYVAILLALFIVSLSLPGCKRTVNSNDAEAIVANLGYDHYELVDIDHGYKSRVINFQYKCYREEHYLRYIDQVNVTYRTGSLGTYGDPEVTTISEGTSWEALIGEWVYQDGFRDFYVNIIDINKDTVTVVIDLINVDHDMGILGSEVTTNISTLGDEKWWVVNVGDKNEIAIYKDDNSSTDIWIYVGSEKHLTESVGSGVSVDGYFLTKIS